MAGDGDFFGVVPGDEGGEGTDEVALDGEGDGLGFLIVGDVALDPGLAPVQIRGLAGGGLGGDGEGCRQGVGIPAGEGEGVFQLAAGAEAIDLAGIEGRDERGGGFPAVGKAQVLQDGMADGLGQVGHGLGDVIARVERVKGAALLVREGQQQGVVERDVHTETVQREVGGGFHEAQDVGVVADLGVGDQDEALCPAAGMPGGDLLHVLQGGGEFGAAVGRELVEGVKALVREKLLGWEGLFGEVGDFGIEQGDHGAVVGGEVSH